MKAAEEHGGAIVGAGQPAALQPVAVLDTDLTLLGSRAHRDAVTRRLLALADLTGILAALALSAVLAGMRSVPEILLLALPTLPAWIVVFKLYDLYERDGKRINHASLDDVPSLFHALVIGTLLFWAYMRIAPVTNLVLEELVIFGPAALLIIVALRGVARTSAARILGPERAIAVGGDPELGRVVDKIRAHPEYGVEVVGALSPDGEASLRSLSALGTLDEIHTVAAETQAERVLLARHDLDNEVLLELIETCRSLSLKVTFLPELFDALGPSVEVDQIEGITVLGINPPALTRSSRFLKRSFDCLISSVSLLALSPVLLAVAAGIKLDSRGSVLFRQRRVGKEGRCFAVLKFRTMVNDAESRRDELMARSSDPNWLVLEADPRVTRLGRFLRRWSIDELPQLVNVLRGEMSLVGPRPLPEAEDALIGGRMRGRLDLTPGITGLWQVLGRTRISFEEMVKLDYLYVTNWSLWLDFRLLLRTAPAVLRRRGAN